jgi:excisionase family DNA binding protein
MARASKQYIPLVQPRLLNVKQAAAYLGATVWFVRTIAWEKKVRSVMFGNRLLFDRADLDSFIDRAKAGA